MTDEELAELEEIRKIHLGSRRATDMLRKIQEEEAAEAAKKAEEAKAAKETGK